MYRTTPLEWRCIKEREGFAGRKVDETSEYQIVQGFGNSLHVISKLGEKNFQIKPGEQSPLYPHRNGHSAAENPLASEIIYQAQDKATSS